MSFSIRRNKARIHAMMGFALLGTMVCGVAAAGVSKAAPTQGYTKVVDNIDSVIAAPVPTASAPSPAKFVVARKKDNETVGQFDTLAEAEAEIERARKQKKAALYIV